MKTFENLIKEVQDTGLCHRCGGCVTFCTSVNYGALEMDPQGMPRYADRAKCIECGLCHAICPEIDELREETRKVSGWIPPFGNVLETTAARAIDPLIRQKATDGGVVTALLVRLFDRGHIDGAIVTRKTGPFMREPFLATSRQELMDSAGFYLDTSGGMKHFGHDYSTYSPSVQEFRPMLQKGLRRVAMVGTPCQIKAFRKMEALGIVPSDSIKYTLGLFCSGNFVFDEPEREKLEKIGGFKWADVKKVNIKENLRIRLKSDDLKLIPLDQLDFMKRYACKYCPDYASEYADIAFGGIGAERGWTTVLARTPKGRAIFADAKGTTVEEFGFQPGTGFRRKLLENITDKSRKKKAFSEKMHAALLEGK